MVRILRVLLIVVPCLSFLSHWNVVSAQTVVLPIQNIPQETQVWCWAAVAQQIVFSLHGPANTPPQCAMVALAYRSSPDTCCNQYGNYNGNPNCLARGSLNKYGG